MAAHLLMVPHAVPELGTTADGGEPAGDSGSELAGPSITGARSDPVAVETVSFRPIVQFGAHDSDERRVGLGPQRCRSTSVLCHLRKHLTGSSKQTQLRVGQAAVELE